MPFMTTAVQKNTPEHHIGSTCYKGQGAWEQDQAWAGNSNHAYTTGDGPENFIWPRGHLQFMCIDNIGEVLTPATVTFRVM